MAPLGERAFSLLVDYGLIFSLNLLLFVVPGAVLGELDELAWSLCLFFSFIVNNVYFIFFELRWQGRTPGKKLNKLCVINRSGGELTPFAVVSRNITRQIEVFFPFTLFFGLFGSDSVLDVVFPVIWLIAITLLPLWNRNHLRMGDLLGNTIVIAMPDKELLPDLSGRTEKEEGPIHHFSKEQLSVYGSYELHILEEILRKAEKGVTPESLRKVVERLARRIGSPLPAALDYKSSQRFLKDFYSAQRAFLEEAKLYGRHKPNQYSPMLNLQPR
ncbi:MAG: RDD family protein [Deltaproteobacteria bacterium]|nr:RDD family protein [Deltaproteobacteria bacterium]